jgi:hypothetical protein
VRTEIFGNINSFGIELVFDEKKYSSFVYGHIYYWVGGTKLGSEKWFDLGDALEGMKWLHHDCAKRESCSLFAIPKRRACRWITTLLNGNDANESGLGALGLPRDVARFNLTFFDALGENNLYLIACQGHGRILLEYPNGEITEVLGEIDEFERAIDDSFQALSQLVVAKEMKK